jgi:hypothetical protein
VSNLNVVLLVLATTVFLLVIAVQVRSSRRKRSSQGRPGATHELSVRTVAKHQVRIVLSGGKRRVLVDGAEVNDPESLVDPALRQSVARGEQALEQLVHGGSQGASPPLAIVVDGVTYHDLSEIPDERIRKIAQDALKHP